MRSGLRLQQLRKAEVVALELLIFDLAVTTEVDTIKAAAEPLDVTVGKQRRELCEHRPPQLEPFVGEVAAVIVVVCCGCGTSANMATILSRACHRCELRGPRCAAHRRLRPCYHRSQLNRMSCPSTRPRITQASATPFPDRYCRGGGVEVSSSRG